MCADLSDAPCPFSISQHHYSAHFCNGGNFSLVSFMDKAAVRANLSIFEEDIAATHAQGLEYVLGYVALPRFDAECGIY